MLAIKLHETGHFQAAKGGSNQRANQQRGLCLETGTEARGNRSVSVSRSQAHLGQLARDGRHRVAGAHGVGWLEVVRDGAPVRALGTGTFVGCGVSN